MDDTTSPDLSLPSVPDNVLQPLLVASNSSTLNEALECLIDIARTSDGRLDLASKHIILPVLQLCQVLLNPSGHHCLILSLKLLRNLCAGEIKNQNLFIEQNGVEILSTVVSFVGLAPSSDVGILRIVLQVLGNVSLAGEEHQYAIWHQLFPHGFLEIARLQNKETCDPLCMVIHTCSGDMHRRFADLCTDLGLDIMIEIIRTVTVAGFREDWLKLLLSKTCLEEPYFSSVFSKLYPVEVVASCQDNVFRTNHFGAEQAFLLSVLSELMNERLGDIVVSNDFALFIFQILRNAVGIVDFTSRAKSSLPTGYADIDVIGYSLTVLRDICACDDPKFFNNDEKGGVVDMLVSSGLVELLITLLRDLEPPEMIQRAMIQSNAKDGKSSKFAGCCPYKGFRRDIVATIGNCAYHRNHVQDKIRDQNGIMLLLQQCVTDEDNPFLREWGIWSMRNILEGNKNNQQLVANLELQGSVALPEVEQMGLRVEVDPNTRRAKLVNS